MEGMKSPSTKLFLFPFTKPPPSTRLKNRDLKVEPDLNHLIKKLKDFKALHIQHITMEKPQDAQDF